MKTWVFYSFLLIGLSACGKFELKGFFTSNESVNKRFEQSLNWNSLNGYSDINITQNSYTIFAMGDSHIGETKNLDAFFQQAQNKEATAIVMLGDITTGHKEDYDVLVKHLPAIDSLRYFAMAGNHDLFFDGWKHFYSIFGSSSYFFSVNTPNDSDLFICLDTGSGTLGNLQLDWLKNLLETTRNNFRYCTIFTHNNLFRFRQTASANPMVEEIQALLDLFLLHSVDMVVTAHDHKRNTDIFGLTTHIIMDALKDDNDNASYLKLLVNDDNIDYDFVEL